MTGDHTVVLGAGVVGLTTALALAERGHRVTVLDAGSPGMESSWAGGGIVSPVPPWAYPEAINQLVAVSRQRYPALLARIEALSGRSVEYRQTGLLLTGTMPEQGRDWLQQCDSQVVWGKAAALEPALAEGDQTVALLPEVTQVRNSQLIDALVLALKAVGVEFHGFEAQRIEWSSAGRVRALVSTDGVRWPTTQLVLALGAWADRVLQASQLSPLGIKPIRGQILLFKHQPRLLNHIVNTGEGYLIPRADGHVLVGSTVEDVGFDRRPDAASYRQLLAFALRQVPALAEGSLRCHWAGLRPGCDHGLPVVGPSPEVEGLWLNLGHYRNGVGLAPVCADLLVAMMRGEDNLHRSILAEGKTKQVQ